MNTDFLVWNNKDIYKDFFNKYDLVISTPIHFPIVWDTSIYWNGNWYIVNHKIPLKNYIWINISKQLQEIEFIYKNDSKTEFKSWNIENFYQINNQLLKDIWLDYEIWFLSEYNWNDPASFISNIIVAILIINKEIKVEDIEKLDLDSDLYKEILDKIIDLDNKLLKDFSFFSNIRNNSSFLWSCMLRSRTHMLNIWNNNKVEYKNIWWNKDFNNLDLNISIINTNTFLKTNYNPKLIIEAENSLKSFCDEMWIDFWDTSLIDSLEKISKFYSLKVFKNLHKLYNNNSNWENFFLDVHAYRKTLKSIFKSFLWNFVDIKKLREIILSYLPYNYMNIFIDQIWSCGDARIVVFSNKIWIIDEEFISKVNQSIWLNMTLDYSSFYDWYKKEWVVIEQYKKQWLFSMFCSWIKVWSYFWNNLLKVNIEKEELFSIKNSLILSKFEKKVYLDWNPITSKDLKSQNFTIELFEVLFSNIWKEVSNDKLSSSSYSKSKNEFSWKIVIPLKKLLKDKLGKSIEIDCYWSLDDFKIKLNNSEVNIYFVL